MPECNIETDSLNEQISIEEVKKAVLNAKMRKASGIDEIPAEVLKNDLCIGMLHRIISLCFQHGIVPRAWKRGIVQPLPKSGDMLLPGNYRGITLISVPCKIYCQILNTRLAKWLEEKGILVDQQNGFRKDRSCLDHQFALYNIRQNERKHLSVMWMPGVRLME